MRREKFLEVFDNLPTKRKQVLLGILRGDTREKIMADVGVSEDALTQHRRQLYKDFKIEVFQNEADDPRSGERKLPLLIALCAQYQPDLISPNTDRISPSRSESVVFPNFSTYNPQTWVGRESIVEELLPKLQGQTRLLWIKGISGIGKTTLGECLASKAWEKERSFEWIYLEILEGQSPDFASVAAELLAKLGDRELDPQERNNPDRLAKRLLQKLQSHSYWIQMDSLERLLNPEQPTEFVDAYWATFLQRFLTESSLVSRLVLTAQAIPTELAEFSDRYPNTWAEYRLNGLLQLEQLEFFAKRGVVVEPSNQDILTRIAKIYEGHPLVLKVIAEDILQEFAGNVSGYWQVYQPEFEQVARELQATRLDETEYNEALDRKVRERIKKSLEKLPADALDLLCRSAVFRRPVPKKFWLAMISDRSSQQQKVAYRVLGDRTLIERESIYQGQFLIRLHNLVRDIAYDLLLQNTSIWETTEREATRLWLTLYKVAIDEEPKLERVRGHLEAIYHFSELEDWESASEILVTTFDTSKEITLPRQLELWGYYKEGVRLCQRLLNQSAHNIKILCLRSIGSYYHRLSEYSKAIEFFQQSFAVAHEIHNFHEEEKALINIGFTYSALGKFSELIQYSEQALIVNRITGNSHTELMALNNIGLANYRIGNYSEAIKSYETSLAIAQKNDDSLGECRTRLGLGNVNCALGKYSDATREYKQALLISRNIENPQEEAYALGNLGNAYFYAKRYSKAIKFHKKALKISQMLGDLQGEAIDLGNMADAIFAIGNFDEALELYQEKLRIASEINERTAQAYALFEIGKSLVKLERYPEALTYLNNSLKLCQEICIPIVEAEALKNLAELHQALGEVEMAQQYCQQALALATELGIPLVAECEALQLKIENEKRKIQPTEESGV